VFFNYGLGTGPVRKSTSAHEPIRWRHVIWDRQLFDREAKEHSPWGWLFHCRVKTGTAFYRLIRAPLAFKAIVTLPRSTAFPGLLKGSDNQRPCRRRRFAHAG
jgi:hypothetical protein